MSKIYWKYFKYVLILMIILMFSGCTIQRGAIKSGSVEVGSKDTYVKVAFNERDIKKIKEYYSRGRGLPPGLAKKKHLPPGIQKQLKRGKGLPRGLRGKDLPSDLERVLTPLPSGFIRLKVDSDIVILNQDTRVIFDIIYDVDL